MNKSILIVLIFALVFFKSNAQENVINVSENASVIADLNLHKLLEINLEKSEKTDEISGFRIQIASNNNRFEIDKQRETVQKELKNFKSHIIYDQPYYKLRIGDYKTRLEAMKYLHEILDVFPSAFIVKDFIKAQ